MRDVRESATEPLRLSIEGRWRENRGIPDDAAFSNHPFVWSSDRRTRIRAELDAYYAILYGLTEHQLRYVLDPSAVHGEEFPGESFRVLKQNERTAFGEYRTQRLILEAFQRLNEGSQIHGN